MVENAGNAGNPTHEKHEISPEAKDLYKISLKHDKLLHPPASEAYYTSVLLFPQPKCVLVFEGKPI